MAELCMAMGLVSGYILCDSSIVLPFALYIVP